MLLGREQVPKAIFWELQEVGEEMYMTAKERQTPESVMIRHT